MIIGCIFCLWHHISLSSSRENAGPSDLFWVPALLKVPSDLFWVPALLKVPSDLFWVPVLLKGPSDLFWVPVLLKGPSDLFWVPVLLKVCFCTIVEVDTKIGFNSLCFDSEIVYAFLIFLWFSSYDCPCDSVRILVTMVIKIEPTLRILLFQYLFTRPVESCQLLLDC